MSDIVKSESFQGIPVRVVQHNGQPMIPLNDIADGITHDRSGLRKLFHRNEEIVGKWSGKVNLATPQGTSQEQICLNHDGVTAMLMKVDFARVKDPVRRQRIIDFQEWAASTLSKIVKGEIVQSAPGPAQLKDEMQKARLCAQETQGSLIAFQKIALERCGLGDYAPALDPVPAITHGETGWYNPTRLVALCNDPDLTPERLNYYLMNKGFQYREGYLWRLTPDGAIHGREYQYEAPSGHKEIRISWRISILYAAGLKRSLSERV